MAELEQTRLFI